LDIVNEPTAAALAFGEALGYLDTTGLPREEMNVMVYDLGGGTFDATLLRLAMGDIKTIATDGDVQLGGHDWDKRLVDYAAESFIKSYQVDPRTDPATLNRLYQEAMEAKHTLTARNRASMRVEYDGRSCEVQLLREQFEEMTADLLERTAYTSRQLLTAAGLEWKDVKRVLLVGGSSRMPMVSRMLKSMTSVEPDRTVNPDEAVARGAALYANYLLAKEEGSQRPIFRVSNVNAHSLGIEGIDTETLRKKNVILIPRNSQLPAKHTERFSTKSDGQRSIVVRVLEGESSLPGECIAIGRTVVRDLPAGLPKGWPVEVTFEYAMNGRLTVRALVPGTQHQAKLELERDVGLSGEGMAHWRTPIAAAAGFEAFEQAVAAAMRRTEEARGATAPPSSLPPPLPPGVGPSPALPPEPVSAPAGPGLKPAARVELALPPTLAPSPAQPERRPEKLPERPAETRPQAPATAASASAALGVPAMPPVSGPAAAAEPPVSSAPSPSPPPSFPPSSVQQGPDVAMRAEQPSGAGWSSSPLPLSVPKFEPRPSQVSDAPSFPPPVPPSGPAEGMFATSPAAPSPTREPLLPRWLSQILGHGTAALLGVAGALVLVKLACIFFPDKFSFPLEWWK
jgi:hypothetical protein